MLRKTICGFRMEGPFVNHMFEYHVFMPKLFLDPLALHDLQCLKGIALK